jgi:hypothetical protein
VKVSGNVEANFFEITEKACTVDLLVGQIAVACREQALGITQVNSAVTDMDKVTQSNAASAEECASAAEELNSQATEQKAHVDALIALVGMRNSSPEKSRARLETEDYGKRSAKVGRSKNQSAFPNSSWSKSRPDSLPMPPAPLRQRPIRRHRIHTGGCELQGFLNFHRAVHPAWLKSQNAAATNRSRIFNSRENHQ